MTSSPPFDSDEESFLDENNETSEHIRACLPYDKWVWSTEDKKKWEKVKVNDGHQTFYERWRKSSDSPKFPDKFPHELSLWEAGEKPLPFQNNRTPGGKIIVTSSYNDMLHRLLRLRIKGMGRNVGAVITGQPGIGKTTFLKFMLASLISARQVVILCNSNKIHLFYRGQVYSRPTSDSFYDLPERGTSSFLIWTLIDVDYRDGGPPLDNDQNVWPIQTSSPNCIRWKSWRKQNRAALLGMPLWSMDELMKGLYIIPEYESFRSALERALDTPALPTNNTVIDAALKVFQAEKEKERERERAEVAAAEEEDQDQDRMDVDDSTRANEADQPRAPVDNAIDILVRDTTEKVGFAPNDVYDGIFMPIATMTAHDAAVRDLTYSKLADIVEMFSKDQHFDGQSHRVVAVHPREVEDSLDSWKVRFKSPRIEKEVLERTRLEEVKHLRKTYQLLRNIPAGSVLAGWIFEVIAHRMLCDAWQGPTQQPIRMVSNNGDPPVFSTDPPPAPDTLPPPPSPLRVGKKIATEVNFPTGKPLVGNVKLDGDRYYTPATTNNPLFDSFTIDHDPHQRTVVISIFQITISQTHGGLAQGYVRIRKIMAFVRNLLGDEYPNTTVKVAYVLVCPNDGLRHEWKMPTDWNKSTKVNNHQGAAFCLRLPVWKDNAAPPPDIDNL